MKNPPHIAGIWELGAGNSHISRLMSLGRLVVEAGYTFTFIARDLSAVQGYAGQPGYPLLQAPYVHQRKQLTRQLVCLADVLILQGFSNRITLQGQQAGWRSLLELCKPDLVILDHAPSALLATYNEAIPRIVIGNSFTLPVPGMGLADWRPLQHRDQLVTESENMVLEAVNNFLESKNKQALQFLADLYTAQGVYISNFPLLDGQAGYRTRVSYHTSSTGHEGPAIKQTRQHPLSMLCYLHPAYTSLDKLLQALVVIQARSVDVTLLCPGLSDHIILKLQQSGITASNKRVNMEQAMSETDWFLGHGGVGSMTQAMRLGKPVLALPMQMEQLNNTLKLQHAGLGEIIPEQDSAEAFVDVFTSAFRNKARFANARDFASANANYASVPLETVVLARIHELLSA